MKKVRYIAGIAGLVPLAAGAMTTAPAHATTAAAAAAEQNASAQAKTVHLPGLKAQAAAAAYTCHLTGPKHYCSARIVGNSVNFHPRSGGRNRLMYSGDKVQVTCYYSGAPLPDKYWDHVDFEASLSRKGPYFLSGHVADSFVNFSGLTAKQVGLSPC